jgi:hypothetical protein
MAFVASEPSILKWLGANPPPPRALILPIKAITITGAVIRVTVDRVPVDRVPVDRVPVVCT